MSDVAIEVEGLGKMYRLGQSVSYKTLRESLITAAGAPFRMFRGGPKAKRDDQDNILWALRDVSFQVKRGEVFGIVGRNGAGKSTVLKILSRITEPTLGHAEIRGRVGSLLEVGTGFHPELSGRENIFLNGAILGMRRTEIKANFDEIVEFAEIAKFIDTPVKRYSSGMYTRLAFAVAAHLEPEILMVDEVLAVGDVAFQQKCLGKMSEVSRSGRTVMFVSHNMAAVENLCDRAMVLDAGRVVEDAEVDVAIQAYLHTLTPAAVQGDLRSLPRERGYLPIIQKVELLNSRGERTTSLQTTEGCTFVIHYKHTEPIKDPDFALRFESSTGVKVFRLHSVVQTGAWSDLPASGTVVCRVPTMPLMPGHFYITPFCRSRGRKIDWIHRALELHMVEADVHGTGRIQRARQLLVHVHADWEVVTSEGVDPCASAPGKVPQ